MGALLARPAARKALLELATNLRDLGVTKADLCGLSLEFGPIPVKPTTFDAETVVEMAKAAVANVRDEDEKIAMWSAS